MENTPLYNAINDNYFKKGNAGLWHNKFCNKWNAQYKQLTPKETGKKDWIKDVASKENSILPTANIQNIVGAENTVCYKTTEPMVIGMGLNHPIENGMLFHHTLGAPYLPGSSVKGLIRAWAEQWTEGKDKVNDEELLQIFGSKNRFKNNKDDNTQAGSVLFFDALPVNKATLKADIMTPHYPEYYDDKGKTPPADNQNPIPITFLSIGTGAIFQFAFKARKNANKDDITTVKKWLDLALKNLGAGAKTAVGYGRMHEANCPEQSPVDKWIEKHTPAGITDKLKHKTFSHIKDKVDLEYFIGNEMVKKIVKESNKEEIYQRMLILLNHAGLADKNFQKKYKQHSNNAETLK